MSKENFQIPEDNTNKTKEIFQNLVSIILPKKLTFEEQIKSLEKQRLEIQNILKTNKAANNVITKKPNTKKPEAA